MRSLTSLSFWAVLLAGTGLTSLVSAAATADGQCVSELCLEASVLGHSVARSIEPTPASLERKELTNAERLVRGLPLKRPSRRRAGIVPRASSSPQNTIEGMIEVRKQSDGSSLGYLTTNTLTNGMFTYSLSTDSALKVTVPLDIGSTSGSGLTLTMVNSPGPLLGLVQGRDSTTTDIATGSFNYLYLDGIALPGSQANAPPSSLTNIYSTATSLSRAAESSVWNVDLTTGAMSVQWTNSGGSSPTTVIFSQGNYIYAGGDTAAFNARYPTPVIILTLHFVQD